MSLGRHQVPLRQSHVFCQHGQIFITACKKTLGDSPEAVDKLLHLHEKSHVVANLLFSLKEALLDEEKNAISFCLTLHSEEVQHDLSLQPMLSILTAEKNKIAALEKGTISLNKHYQAMIHSIAEQQVDLEKSEKHLSFLQPVIKLLTKHKDTPSDKHMQLEKRKQYLSYLCNKDVERLDQDKKQVEENIALMDKAIKTIEEKLQDRIRQQERLFYAAVSKPVMLLCLLIFHASKNFYTEIQAMLFEINKEETLKKLEQVVSAEDFCLVDIDEQNEIWKESEITKIKTLSREIVSFFAKMQSLLQTMWCPDHGVKKGNALYKEFKNEIDIELANEKFSINSSKFNIPDSPIKFTLFDLSTKLINIPRELIQEHKSLHSWLFGPHIRATTQEIPLKKLALY